MRSFSSISADKWYYDAECLLLRDSTSDDRRRWVYGVLSFRCLLFSKLGSVFSGFNICRNKSVTLFLRYAEIRLLSGLHLKDVAYLVSSLATYKNSVLIGLC